MVSLELECVLGIETTEAEVSSLRSAATPTTGLSEHSVVIPPIGCSESSVVECISTSGVSEIGFSLARDIFLRTLA
jgi:hypothetical protein